MFKMVLQTFGVYNRVKKNFLIKFVLLLNILNHFSQTSFLIKNSLREQLVLVVVPCSCSKICNKQMFQNFGAVLPYCILFQME
jgi:hypothetical protein